MGDTMSVEIQRHNETVLASLEPGDGVEFKRGVYSHWAVFAGQDWYWFGLGPSNVIHLTGDGASSDIATGHAFSVCGISFDKANVKKENFWDVAKNSKAYKDERNNDKYSRSEILKRAKYMIGPIDYNVLWGNCEHFVNYCRFGEWKSDQMEEIWGWIFSLIVATCAAFVYGIYCMWLLDDKDK